MLTQGARVVGFFFFFNWLSVASLLYCVCACEVTSVMSDSLWPHELQHARPPCPSPTPWVHSNSRPSSRWCHPDISSSVIPFSFCPQSLPASESFPMSQLFAWGGQSTGVWAFFGTAFFWDWNENWPFPVLWPLLSFPNLLAHWVQHFHSIIFQDLK